MPGRCVLANMVCPETADTAQKRYCPWWWETVQTNALGEQRVLRSCGVTQLPTYLIEVIKASNRPAAAVESVRNELAVGLSRIAQAGFAGELLAATQDSEHGRNQARIRPPATASATPAADGGEDSV